MTAIKKATILWGENKGLWFHVTKSWRGTVEDEDILSYAFEACLKAYERDDITSEAYRLQYAIFKLKRFLRWNFGDEKKRVHNYSESLDVCIGEGTTTKLELLEDSRKIDYNFDLDEIINSTLTEREATVVRMWSEGVSFNEIGKHFNFSKQYAQSTYTKALVKLRFKIKND